MSKSKVFIVNQEHKADYCVFFVQQPHKEKNHQIIQDCELAKSEHQAQVKVFVVNQEHKADICILQKHFPKAG